MRLHSTGDRELLTNFRAALNSSLAPDGGLWAPALAPWSDWDELIAMEWPARGVEIVARLLDDEADLPGLREGVAAALDLPLPVRDWDDDTAVLELWHGPTLAFKDFGARLLAALISAFDGPGAARRTVLAATSGDTGAAVAAAFGRTATARVVVLYPAGRVSPLQELQIAGLRGIEAWRIAGSFDDCQALVKRAFADPALARTLRLTSANSIHVGRLLAQVATFSAIPAARARAGRDPRAWISVPSGNFGHLCAGLYAERLGMPVAGFIAATNANRTVTDHLDGGEWRPRPSVSTLSNAMDVGDPSGWARIRDLFDGSVDALRRRLRWASIDDEATAIALRSGRREGRSFDPHTAVAAAALAQVRRPGEAGAVVSTAHPCKFPEVIAAITGAAEPPPPGAFAGLGPVVARDLPATWDAVAAALRALDHD